VGLVAVKVRSQPDIAKVNAIQPHQGRRVKP
jgi:hypothetical protein